MGKRNKSRLNNEFTVEEKNTSITDCQEGHPKSSNTNDNKMEEKLKSKKRKSEISTNDKQCKMGTSKEKKIKKAKHNTLVNKNVDAEKSNSNICVNNEPQEVSTDPVPQKKKKNKQFLNEDEAEIKDEDIDKFCDEIDNEDNQQFENWVKLIEANWHSNKKNNK